MIRIPDLIDIVLYFFLFMAFQQAQGVSPDLYFFFMKEMIIFDNIDPSLFSV